MTNLRLLASGPGTDFTIRLAHQLFHEGQDSPGLIEKNGLSRQFFNIAFSPEEINV